MDKNYNFNVCNEKELIELELLYWDLMCAGSCSDLIDTELKLAELYCSGKNCFQKKQDFINLMVNKINNGSNFLKNI